MKVRIAYVIAGGTITGATDLVAAAISGTNNVAHDKYGVAGVGCGGTSLSDE